MSGRKVRQDIAGYNVAIRSLEVEHTRALENTTRTPELYQAMLDLYERGLEVLRRERRDLMLKARSEGFRAPQQQRAPRARASAERESEALVSSAAAKSSATAKSTRAAVAR